MISAKVHVFVKYEPGEPEDIFGVNPSSLVVFSDFADEVRRLVGDRVKVKLERHSLKSGCLAYAADVLIYGQVVTDVVLAISILQSGDKLVKVFEEILLKSSGPKSKVIASHQSLPDVLVESDTPANLEASKKGIIVKTLIYSASILFVAGIAIFGLIDRKQSQFREARFLEKVDQVNEGLACRNVLSERIGRPEDYTVIFLAKATNGTTSLRSLSTNPIDAIILDGEVLATPN